MYAFVLTMLILHILGSIIALYKIFQNLNFWVFLEFIAVCGFIGWEIHLLNELNWGG